MSGAPDAQGDAPPPMWLHPVVSAWRCESRGHCCRTWRVDVTPHALQTMAARLTDKGDVPKAMALLRAYPADKRHQGSCALPQQPDGSCLFLRADRLCAYRVAHGWETLPTSCRRFPYLGILTPERRLYGLSFACPTALALLANDASEAWRACPDDDAPPTEVLCDFAGEPEDGSRAMAQAFWQEHWRWVELWWATRGTPEERLGALIAHAAGEAPAALELARGPEHDPFAALVALGAEPAVMRALGEKPLRTLALERVPPDPPDDALLARYLTHRLVVPEFLMSGASLVRLLGVLCAVAARFRLERARGRRGLEAVTDIDSMLIHREWVVELFPPDVPEARAFESLALAARSAWR